MIRVQIFYGVDSATELEEDVNDWLEDMEDEKGFCIRQIMQSETRTTWTITVLYEHD